MKTFEKPDCKTPLIIEVSDEQFEFRLLTETEDGDDGENPSTLHTAMAIRKALLEKIIVSI
jgi:hypothetical protein